MSKKISNRFVSVFIVLSTFVLTTTFAKSYSTPTPNKMKKPPHQLLLKKDYLKEIAPLQRDYKIGDSGHNILKMKEWLMLWQLNENFTSDIIKLEPHMVFDKTTEKVLKQIQEFVNLPATGILDNTTWQALVSPMTRAFDTRSFDNKTLREKMKYFATKHLQYRASELVKGNIGPWVRAYMDDHDGDWAYWCQGFVCTILDQTFSTIGEYFNEYYANTWACETMRKKARNKKLLVTNQQLQDKTYIPQEGDIVLYISDKDGHAHHTEIIYQILDKTTGEMLTVGGNTNFSGSRNGVGTFLVDRNFLDKNVEVVKLVDVDVINQHKQYPKTARKLLQNYPNIISAFDDNHIVFESGKRLLFNDNKTKTTDELLVNPDIQDQFHYRYQKGTITTQLKPNFDPGRVTNQDFFKTMYGSTQVEVEKNLVDVIWAPKLDGRKIRVTKINGVASRIKAIGRELDNYPELKPFIHNIGGSYKWRKVKGTERLSLHSFGIAIDLNVAQSSYWEWDCKCADEHQILTPHKNKIPQIIIDTFEKHGFIWGGKWYHYDTMHFEYRPELL
jgi:hypothetical protein